MPEITDLSTGGTAMVILGKGFDLPTDFAYNPQIVPVNASDLPSDVSKLNEKIPSTCRIVVIGGDLPGPEFGILRTVLTRRNLTFIQRRNDTALRDVISKLLPQKKALTVPIAEVIAKTNGDTPPQTSGKKTIAPAGALAKLIAENADLNKGSAEEARRLMRIAQERGIPTTVASLAQAISNVKRKGGRSETPKSIMSAQQRALITLDESLAGLSLIREYVANVEKENAELKDKLNKYKALAAALKDD